MVKRPNIKEQIFVTKLSRTTPTTDSLRTIIPYDLLKKLKLTPGDKVCWKLDDESKRLTCWRETRKDRADAAKKIIDIKEVTIEGGKPVKTDLKKLPLTTANTETEPQITATSHI